MEMVDYALVAAAAEDFKKEMGDFKGGNWEVMTKIMAVLPDGKTRFSGITVCHAGLRDFPVGTIAVYSGLMKPPAGSMLEEDEALFFLDYLLSRSPYSSVFLTKSAHQALLEKVVISRTDVPSNLMAAGLVATRMLWEFPSKARVFVDLAKAGVQEDLAFFLAHISGAPFKRDGNISFGGAADGHACMRTYDFGKKSFENFLKHTPTKVNENYVTRTNYYGYNNMYGADGGLDKFVHGNFPYKPKAKGDKVNPFAKAKAGEDKSCAYEDGIAAMVEFQKEIFKWVGWETNNA